MRGRGAAPASNHSKQARRRSTVLRGPPLLYIYIAVASAAVVAVWQVLMVLGVVVVESRSSDWRSKEYEGIQMCVRLIAWQSYRKNRKYTTAMMTSRKTTQGAHLVSLAIKFRCLAFQANFFESCTSFLLVDDISVGWQASGRVGCVVPPVSHYPERHPQHTCQCFAAVQQVLNVLPHHAMHLGQLCTQC